MNIHRSFLSLLLLAGFLFINNSVRGMNALSKTAQNMLIDLSACKIKVIQFKLQEKICYLTDLPYELFNIVCQQTVINKNHTATYPSLDLTSFIAFKQTNKNIATTLNQFTNVCWWIQVIRQSLQKASYDLDHATFICNSIDDAHSYQQTSLYKNLESILMSNAQGFIELPYYPANKTELFMADYTDRTKYLIKSGRIGAALERKASIEEINKLIDERNALTGALEATAQFYTKKQAVERFNLLLGAQTQNNHISKAEWWEALSVVCYKGDRLLVDYLLQALNYKSKPFANEKTLNFKDADNYSCLHQTICGLIKRGSYCLLSADYIYIVQTLVKHKVDPRLTITLKIGEEKFAAVTAASLVRLSFNDPLADDYNRGLAQNLLKILEK